MAVYLALHGAAFRWMAQFHPPRWNAGPTDDLLLFSVVFLLFSLAWSGFCSRAVWALLGGLGPWLLLVSQRGAEFPHRAELIVVCWGVVWLGCLALRFGLARSSRGGGLRRMQAPDAARMAFRQTLRRYGVVGRWLFLR